MNGRTAVISSPSLPSLPPATPTLLKVTVEFAKIYPHDKYHPHNSHNSHPIPHPHPHPPPHSVTKLSMMIPK